MTLSNDHLKYVWNAFTSADYNNLHTMFNEDVVNGRMLRVNESVFVVCISDLLHAADVLEWLSHHLHTRDSSVCSSA